MSGQLASTDLAPSPSPTCLCDEPQSINWLLATLAATTALFLFTTILAVILILFLMRKLRKDHHPAQYQEKTECKYWEDPMIPTLKETLATDSKQPNIWYSMNTETFQHNNDGSQGDNTGSNEVVPVNKKEKVRQPKRRAPQPPTKGRWGGWRKKQTAVPAEYEIPNTVAKSKKHAYMELDLKNVQPPSVYAKPSPQTSRK